MSNQSSLKLWFLDLSWMCQGVLLSAIRNCDNIYNDNTPQKTLTRGIRATCLKAAVTKGSFNARRPDKNLIETAAEQFTDSCIDHMPLHYTTHLMHAAEVIAYCHPSSVIRQLWFNVYALIVHALHLNIETIVQFNDRLKDDPEQVKRENQHDAEAYRTKEYDNTGTVNEQL